MPFLGPKGLELKPVKTGNDFADAILGLILPMTLEEQVTGLASPASFLGMAGKKFLPGPKTLEGFIEQLAKIGSSLGPRHSLRPSVRHPLTKEIYAGSVGGNHPINEFVDVLSKRKQNTPQTFREIEFGYQTLDENAPFIPEILANYLQKPGNAKIVDNLLKRGSSVNDIIDILKKGKPDYETKFLPIK